MAASSFSRAFNFLAEVEFDKLRSYLDYYLSKQDLSAFDVLIDEMVSLNDDLRNMQQNRSKGVKSANPPSSHEVRDVVYEIQDLLDELAYRKLSGRRKRPKDASLINQIKKITKRLHLIEGCLNRRVRQPEMMKKDIEAGKQQPEPVMTVSTNAGKIYGRDREIEKLTKMLRQSSISGQISVHPVIGTGGVGKTTLVQCVFNSQDVANHFHEKAWICVSENFDRLRITREILESFATYRGSRFPHNANLEFLERMLEMNLESKKFLLVLDDVWSSAWMELLLFLESTEIDCVKIIVIARDQRVLNGMGRRYETILKGLKEDDCWSIFMNEDEMYSTELQAIGRQIGMKLKGSPLAAKMVGKMLRRDLSEEHWKHVMDSDLWDLEIDDSDDIMPALMVCFSHLSSHLQLCFVFCSVFPKGYQFDVTELVYMWLAHGYLPQVENTSKTVEEVGRECFNELLAMSFFTPHPCLPFYIIHDQLHDLARRVSSDECYIYEGQSRKKIRKNVHHLCVRGQLECSWVYEIKNLRTLVLYKAKLYVLKLDAVKNIRVLIIVDCDVQEFPNVVHQLKHLRYLDLRQTSIKSWPESFTELHHLIVLRLPDTDIFLHSSSNHTGLPFSRINHGIVPDFIMHYDLKCPVNDDLGHQIQLLNDMKELKGTLTIRSLENIKKMEGVSDIAKLKERDQVECLRLVWSNSGSGCDSEVAFEGLESLQPHHSLKYLYIDGYNGFQSPSWLSTLELQNLHEIKLCSCKNLSRLPQIGQLQLLKYLYLSGMDHVLIEGSDDIQVVFPSLEKLELERVSVSFEGMSLSIATMQDRSCFPRLRYLRISKCSSLNGFPWSMLSSLKRLRIISSPRLNEQLPYISGLTSLRHLDITTDSKR
ncbi:P-loop containing nucleoside triphosphate hydrolase protein [Dioscorea alata]|uniref:P-loop containing nucleoside triphosphate hydrolase protein n=1 Tax=Dioscorea alata TaxID=55571 RepID=A0ACB7U8T9_DIOAL|nr:P-loop containing nucleoside triphosphate hydrolase protein [Dioscorea alata]